tara:strand:+ start:886 stop:1065 length:180 start_codon:yes stop_codon:yes gene_type:complete
MEIIDFFYSKTLFHRKNIRKNNGVRNSRVVQHNLEDSRGFEIFPLFHSKRGVTISQERE